MFVLCLAVHAKRFQCHKQQWIHSSQMKRVCRRFHWQILWWDCTESSWRMQLMSFLSLLKQRSIQQYTSVVYKTRTVLDPSQNLFLAMYVMSLCHSHWHLWVILFLAIMYFTEYHSDWMLTVGTQTSVSFNHCLHIPITESVNEMSICVLFVDFIITHKTGYASHEQPQKNLHYMMTKHKIPVNWLKFQTIW